MEVWGWQPELAARARCGAGSTRTVAEQRRPPTAPTPPAQGLHSPLQRAPYLGREGPGGQVAEVGLHSRLEQVAHHGRVSLLRLLHPAV